MQQQSGATRPRFVNIIRNYQPLFKEALCSFENLLCSFLFLLLLCHGRVTAKHIVDIDTKVLLDRALCCFLCRTLRKRFKINAHLRRSECTAI